MSEQPKVEPQPSVRSDAIVTERAGRWYAKFHDWGDGVEDDPSVENYKFKREALSWYSIGWSEITGYHGGNCFECSEGLAAHLNALEAANHDLREALAQANAALRQARKELAERAFR